jgi:hypothetical protein
MSEKNSEIFVFPDALLNETRLWRNIGKRAPTWLTWTGLAVLAVFVFGFMAFCLVICIKEGVGWAVASVALVIFGPIFGVIAWATKRNLRNIEIARRNVRVQKH